VNVTLLDGPLGTELAARGVATPAPAWSSAALVTAPEVVFAIHRDYAAAGATVHTANTFRTTPRVHPERWEELARLAVRLAREAVPPGHRVAGSLAPVADCYSPWLSPPDARADHRALARVLADAGCDVLLCETFPHPGEALAAAAEAVGTGVETWLALTAGPAADLLTPAQVGETAIQALALGVSAVLVNCVPAARTGAYVRALSSLGVPFGAYANAGDAAEGIGWGPAPDGPTRYAELAAGWVEEGATLVGTCCGTGPAHVATLAAALAR